MLFMILSRLVWLQLRDHDISLPNEAQASVQIFRKLYPEGCNPQVTNILKVAAEYPTIERSQFLWFGSTIFALVLGSSCNATIAFHDFWIKFHMLVFFWTVVANVLIARLLCRNWLIPLFIGTMLFSRGVLLAHIGVVSYDNLICFLISLWFCAQVHFYRTYFLPSLYASFAFLAVACMFNATLFSLGLPFVFLVTRLSYLQAFAPTPLRYSDFNLNTPSSRPLHPIALPIGLFLNQKERAYYLLKQWFFCFFLLCLLVLLTIAGKIVMINLDFWQTLLIAFTNIKDNQLWDILMFWFNQPNWHHFDIHFTLSVILCFFVAAIPTIPNYRSLREASLTLAFAIFTTNLCFIVSRHFDHAVAQQAGLHHGKISYAGESFSHPYIWLEPIILTFGILALVHLLQTIKVWLDHRSCQT